MIQTPPQLASCRFEPVVLFHFLLLSVPEYGKTLLTVLIYYTHSVLLQTNGIWFQDLKEAQFRFLKMLASASLTLRLFSSLLQAVSNLEISSLFVRFPT